MDFRKEAKNDGDETKVNLGRVNARVCHSLCKALFPIVAVGFLRAMSSRTSGGPGMVSLLFLLNWADAIPQDAVENDADCGLNPDDAPTLNGAEGM